MSFNSLFGLGSHSEDANLEGWWPLQDDAASTAVDDVSSNAADGTLVGGDNTSTKSTTGPNAWLAKAFDMNGTDDRITATLGSTIAEPLTLLCRANFDVQNVFQGLVLVGTAGTGTHYFGMQATDSAGTRLMFKDTSFASLAGGAYASAGGWYDYGALYITSSSQKFYQNSDTSSYSGTTSRTITPPQEVFIGSNDVGAAWINGQICDVSVWSREITTAEWAEWRAGPEPVNSAAPVVSGTETDGSTLSCTTGTWGIDAPFSSGSNGTITYGYQWTRSDDGSGTGEADIGSATASTYTLTGTDVGKFIRCRVRGTNDGGFDSAADTNSNFTGAIGASGGNRRRRVLIGAV